MVTKWSLSSHALLIQCLPRGHSILIQWSNSFHSVVTFDKVNWGWVEGHYLPEAMTEPECGLKFGYSFSYLLNNVISSPTGFTLGGYSVVPE